MIAKIVLAILLLIAMFESRYIAENIDNRKYEIICNAISIFFAVFLGYLLAQIIIEIV